jgi:hypothetical protein
MTGVAVASALSLTGIDIVYPSRRQIGPIYLEMPLPN